jgi:hypothetical protein
VRESLSSLLGRRCVTPPPIPPIAHLSLTPLNGCTHVGTRTRTRIPLLVEHQAGSLCEWCVGVEGRTHAHDAPDCADSNITANFVSFASHPPPRAHIAHATTHLARNKVHAKRAEKNRKQLEVVSASRQSLQPTFIKLPVGHTHRPQTASAIGSIRAREIHPTGVSPPLRSVFCLTTVYFQCDVVLRSNSSVRSKRRFALRVAFAACMVE